MSSWIFAMLNISSSQIWRNWDAFILSPTVPKWRCLAGSKVWQGCFRDQGRQLRDVLWFRQCGGLNGAGERANWQPCATLKTVSDWQVHVSPSLSFTLSFRVSCCLFWKTLVQSLLVPATDPEMNRASSNHQIVVHPDPFDVIRLTLHCLWDFWSKVQFGLIG